MDLAKAYDRVEWDLLFKIMGAFGFDDKVTKIIRELITTPMFSILINGSPTNFFKNSRGLRQGDPISRILFTILAESMSRLIHKLKQSKTIKGLQPSSANVFCTHQQFVDDTILMGYSLVKEADAFKTALNSYALATGQQVNWDKLAMYFLNTPVIRQQKIAKIIGCKVEMLPSTYLGLPLGLAPPNSFWNMLFDKINKRLARWKGSMLSQAGKLQLLQATLQNLPVYALTCLVSRLNLLKLWKESRRDFYG